MSSNHHLTKVDSLLKEYDDSQSLYVEFVSSMAALMGRLVAEHGFKVLSVTPRVKDRPSLRDKLLKRERIYSTLDDVTDIAGLRIITYSANDVDSISSVIKKEFYIDQVNSVDKRALLDPDRFGYLSVHYIVRLKSPRSKLPEYERFTHLKMEIQIRSILQHAWAEIEHDLGYKSKQAVPSEIQRRLSRLAGLLEMADDEFDRVREDLVQYRKEVADKIREDPGSVTIDKDSLVAYVNISNRVKQLDERIATNAGSRVTPSVHYIVNLINKLEFAGLKTIADVDDSLVHSGRIVIHFAEIWIAQEYEELHSGICLFYLCYVLVAKEGLKKMEQFVQALRIGNPRKPDERQKLPNQLISVYKQALTDLA